MSERVSRDRAYYKEYNKSRLGTRPDIDIQWYFDRVEGLERQLAEANERYNMEFHNVDAWHMKWTEQGARLAEAQTEIARLNTEMASMEGVVDEVERWKRYLTAAVIFHKQRNAPKSTLEQAREALEGIRRECHPKGPGWGCCPICRRPGGEHSEICVVGRVVEALAALDAGKEQNATVPV